MIPVDYEMFFGLKLTDEQKAYIKSILENKITFVNAPAGSGKTTIAVAMARLLKEHTKSSPDLYYTFSPVEEGKMGFRPGGQQTKELAYRKPLVDALEVIREDPIQAIYNEEDPMAMKQGKFWVFSESHVFMRGTNKPNCTLIIDEAQNFTHSELKKVLTRVHDDGKIIVIGHTGQIDLKNPKDSGFADYIEWFDGKPYCGIHTLTKNFRGPVAQHADDFSIEKLKAKKASL
jgi:phosphate starvation-inducible protein PhoH and related proteins